MLCENFFQQLVLVKQIFVVLGVFYVHFEGGEVKQNLSFGHLSKELLQLLELLEIGDVSFLEGGESDAVFGEVFEQPVI